MAKSSRTTKPTSTPRASKPKATDSPIPPPGGPDADAVARRAYELYQQRGGTHGSDLEDWLQAEREIRARRPQTR